MNERRFTLGLGSSHNPWRFASAFRSYRRSRPGVKIGRNEQARLYGLQMGSQALVRQWIGSGSVPLYLLQTATS